MRTWMRSLLGPCVRLGCVVVPIIWAVTFLGYPFGVFYNDRVWIYLTGYASIGTLVLLVAMLLTMWALRLAGRARNCARVALTPDEAAARVSAFLRGLGIEHVRSGGAGGVAYHVDGGDFRVELAAVGGGRTRVCVGPVPWTRDPRFDRLLGLRKALGVSSEPN